MRGRGARGEHRSPRAARSVRVRPLSPEWASLRWHGDCFALRAALSDDMVSNRRDRAELRASNAKWRQFDRECAQ